MPSYVCLAEGNTSKHFIAPANPQKDDFSLIIIIIKNGRVWLFSRYSQARRSDLRLYMGEDTKFDHSTPTLKISGQSVRQFLHHKILDLSSSRESPGRLGESNNIIYMIIIVVLRLLLLLLLLLKGHDTFIYPSCVAY